MIPADPPPPGREPDRAEPPAAVTDLLATARRLAASAFVAEAFPGGRLLMVGIEEGLLDELVSHPKVELVLVEPDDARANGAIAAGVAEVYRADPAELPFDDRSFAGVAYLWPMENLHHTALVVDELLRVLEPDGVLFGVGSPQDEVLELLTSRWTHVAVSDVVTLLYAAAVPPGTTVTIEEGVLQGIEQPHSVIVAASRAPLPPLHGVVRHGAGDVDAAATTYELWSQSELRRLAPRADGLETEQGRLREAQRVVLAAEQKAARARTSELERDELRRQVAELNHRLNLLQGSLTWRSTAPLRRVVAKGKRVAQEQLRDTALDTLRRWRSY